MQHSEFIETQIATWGGDHICGKALTGAGIMMNSQLGIAQKRGLIPVEKHPELTTYIEMLSAGPAWKRVEG